MLAEKYLHTVARSELAAGDMVLATPLLHELLGSTRAVGSGLGLLHRRCDRCTLHLSGECPFLSPGLTAEVNGAATCTNVAGGSADHSCIACTPSMAAVSTPQRSSRQYFHPPGGFFRAGGGYSLFYDYLFFVYVVFMQWLGISISLVTTCSSLR